MRVRPVNGGTLTRDTGFQIFDDKDALVSVGLEKVKGASKRVRQRIKALSLTRVGLMRLGNCIGLASPISTDCS